MLGGEQSGHVISLDGHVTGDGLAAALLLCRALDGALALRGGGGDAALPAGQGERSGGRPRLSPAVLARGGAARRRARRARPHPRPPVRHGALVRVLVEAESAAEAEISVVESPFSSGRSLRVAVSSARPPGHPRMRRSQPPRRRQAGTTKEKRQMCGIIGYVGPRECKHLLLFGLERLEYRGYDSAGIALLEEDGLEYTRAVGNLQNLKLAAGEGPSPATTGLGTRAGRRTAASRRRTRTRSPATTPRELAIVLNGIVENYRELRERLRDAGHVFTSETDAETVTHLIEEHYDGDLVEATRLAFNELEGHFAFVAIHRDHPGLLVGARHQCPLVVGVGRGETFLASNAAAFLRETREVHFPEDGDLVAITADGARFSRAADGSSGRARAGRARLGRRERREGRLRDVHAEGDLRAARRRRRDDRRPRAPRPARARGARHVRRRPAACCAASSSSRPARRTTRPSPAATRSRSGRACRSSTTSPRSGSTATRCSTRARS